jgi:hypothetical protein
MLVLLLEQGHMPLGRKPDHERRRQMAALRQQGLTLAEIGQKLRVSRQCVHEALQRMAGPRTPPVVTCSSCQGNLVLAGILPEEIDKVLCLACVQERADAPFGQRLQACRLAAGLNRAELARQSGVSVACIADYERCSSYPQQANFARLVRVLGPRLAPEGRKTRRWRR